MAVIADRGIQPRCVLAIHGWGDNAASFEPLAQRIEAPIVRVDLAGHGRSAHKPPSAQYGELDYALDVMTLMDAIGAAEVVLVGHSMGGAIATIVAAILQRRVRSLIVLDAFGGYPAEEDEAPQLLAHHFAGRSYARNKNDRTFSSHSEAIAWRCKRSFGLPPDCAARLIDRELDMVGERFVRRTDDRVFHIPQYRLTEAQHRSFIRKLQCPSQILVNAMASRDHIDRLSSRHRLCPSSTFQEVGDSHYFHMTTHADLVARLVDEAMLG